jgi:RNA polymerase sigma-70 factor (ECF subfamily)
MNNTMNITNDTELVRQYAAGDAGAFQEIVRRYKDGVYAFLHRFLGRADLVEDVFQETFLQAYVSRETFDVSKPLRPWLFTIAANKARDALRRRQRVDATNLGSLFDDEEHSIDDVLNTLDHDDVQPYDGLIREETATEVRQVIARMPAKLREVLLLAYFQKLPYAELAGILGVPVGTVKSRLHTAVGRFAEEWNARTLCEVAN